MLACPARLLAEREEAGTVCLALVVADVVYLEGGMRDAVLAGEQIFEFAAAGVAVFVLADQDVGGEGSRTRWRRLLWRGG